MCKAHVFTAGIIFTLGLFACAHLMGIEEGAEVQYRCRVHGGLLRPMPTKHTQADYCYRVYCYTGSYSYVWSKTEHTIGKRTWQLDFEDHYLVLTDDLQAKKVWESCVRRAGTNRRHR